MSRPAARSTRAASVGYAVAIPYEVSVTSRPTARRPSELVLARVRSPNVTIDQPAASPSGSSMQSLSACAAPREGSESATTSPRNAASITHQRMAGNPARGGGERGSPGAGDSGGLRRRRLFGRLGDERRLHAALDGLLGHDALLDVAPRGQLELHLEEDLLDDRAQAARPGLPLQRPVGDRLQRVTREHQLDRVEREEALELLDDRVARLREDRDEVGARELVHGAGDGQAPDELRGQAVLHQVLGQAALEQLAQVAVGLG